MRIRKATAEDLVRCQELCATPELQFVGGEYATTEHIKHFLDEGYFLVAEDDEGAVQGMVYGEPLRAGGAVLWMVAVDAEQRGKGTGKALVEAYEEHCREQGREWVFLMGLDTEQHKRLYKGLGFSSGKLLREYVKEL